MCVCGVHGVSVCVCDVCGVYVCVCVLVCALCVCGMCGLWSQDREGAGELPGPSGGTGWLPLPLMSPSSPWPDVIRGKAAVCECWIHFWRFQARAISHHRAALAPSRGGRTCGRSVGSLLPPALQRAESLFDAVHADVTVWAGQFPCLRNEDFCLGV